jgi:hypothetical protein
MAHIGIHEESFTQDPRQLAISGTQVIGMMRPG